MYKICVFIPSEAVEQVKSAMFEAGAGRIGNYDCCSWQTLGQGQFRPQQGSKPYIGSEGDIETVEEYRVEMVCTEVHVADVIAALKSSHPYEEPAYDVWKLEDI